MISTLVLGETDLSKKENEIKRKIKKIIMHPSWKSWGNDNDIAILELKSPVPMRKGIHHKRRAIVVGI